MRENRAGAVGGESRVVRGPMIVVSVQRVSHGGEPKLMTRSELYNAPSLDVLRLSANEVEAINRELDAQAEQFQGNNRRQDERHPYRAGAKMVATVFHPGGTTTRYLIKPRNISRTGLGFLHGSFLHLGTRIIVSLETLRHTLVNVTGQIVFCKFVRGNVHEIGVRFSQPIELAQFIFEGGDDMAEGALPQLIGRVLLVEREESDRQLLRFIFERLNVQVSMSTTVDDAVDKLTGGMNFDVAMLDVDAEDDVADAIARLRAPDRDVPLIALTADESHPLKHKANGEQCNGVLVKPLDGPAMAMTLLQFLPLAAKPMSPAAVEPLYSTMWQDLSARPLVLEYLDRLSEQVVRLRGCFKADAEVDMRHAAKLCLTIKGTAGSYGFPQISEAAQSLRQLVDAGEDGAAAVVQLNELAGLCESACRVRLEKAA